TRARFSLTCTTSCWSVFHYLLHLPLLSRLHGPMAHRWCFYTEGICGKIVSLI
ncbi:hypothetical protein BCR44DRAFT_1440617, partial [Catenaria anguillulae PL171]